MSPAKKVRIVDEELLAAVRRIPCLGCVDEHPEKLQDIREAIERGEHMQSLPHHVKSRGAGGDDVPENLMPLCLKHHTEIHKVGEHTMSGRYPTIGHWLQIARKMSDDQR